MPKPTSKSRQELRSRFVRNAIPTETDFADLIAASLNQADDGVLKLPDQPLGLVRQKPDQPVLRFFADPAAEGSVWQVQLGAEDKPGFGLAAADGKLALFVDGATGNVGIGTISPVAKLQITGNVSISSAEGQNIACKNNSMAPGSLAIGGIDRNYGGGTKWNNNTAGLLLETLDNTEIAIHDSQLRLASFMYYESVNNCFTIGRDMGWGGISAVNMQGSLYVNGQTNILTGSNPIRFSSSWTGFPDNRTNGAEICNDTDYHKTLMITGNQSASGIGGGRKVSIWDILEVNGTLRIQNPDGWGKDGKLALFVDGTTGKVGMGTSDPASKLNIVEPMGTAASANSGTLLLDHEDAGGASSIVFRSKVNRGSDHAFIEFRDKNPLIDNVEAALLTIGMQNDARDHIALMPSGNVGVGTTTPGCKLDVNGDAYISGCLGIRAGSEIFFSDDGQIRCKDDNHRILFRRNDSKMELREYGDIVFSSGSTQGQETSRVVIHGSGNVGIGTTKPEFKLDVNGTVRLGGFTSEEKEEWPNIVWCRDMDKGWDEGLIKHGKSYGFFGRAGFGVHIYESRSFELFSTGWRPLVGIEGGSGNTSIRGQTNILTGSNPIRFSSAWTGFTEDKTNGAEISNDTSGHKTLMIVGNKSNGGGRRVSVWDILEVNGSFQVNNNGNTFKIDTLADRAVFTLAKAFHGPGRQISWDGDNNWDQYSDETLKTNINIETGILPRLLQIDVKSFQWKDDLESKKRQLGFIAQDVRLAFPDLVKEKPFGDQSLMSLNYTNFGILAVGAIKELNAIMAAEIQELRDDLDRLRQQVGD